MMESTPIQNDKNKTVSRNESPEPDAWLGYCRRNLPRKAFCCDLRYECYRNEKQCSKCPCFTVVNDDEYYMSGDFCRCSFCCEGLQEVCAMQGYMRSQRQQPGSEYCSCQFCLAGSEEHCLVDRKK
jgi:hypothetical protein